MIDGLVSTIIPVFNRPAMLREAVASVLAQTYRPIEIVIVDDGSTDNETPALCLQLAERHTGIVTIRIANGGPGVAREAGRQLIRGEFVQYLDSDDLLRPTKFERQVSTLRAEPSAGVAYCKTFEYQVGEEARDWPSAHTGERIDRLFPSLLSGRRWQTPTPLFRRTLIDAVGPWASLRQEEDWEYDARVASLGARLVWCPEFLADVRHHEDARAGGGSQNDPARMTSRCRAHALIYQHATASGIIPDDPHMRRFARELFLLARQSGALGLGVESAELFRLARAASGPIRSKGLDFRLYRLAATILGWTGAGKLAWGVGERFRSRHHKVQTA